MPVVACLVSASMWTLTMFLTMIQVQLSPEVEAAEEVEAEEAQAVLEKI